MPCDSSINDTPRRFWWIVKGASCRSSIRDPKDCVSDPTTTLPHGAAGLRGRKDLRRAILSQ